MLKNLFAMLISENLQLLTIDIGLLASNLRNIITSCLGTILPKFLSRPRRLETLSKLYRQFSHELARISKFSRRAGAGSGPGDSDSVKQTIYLLKSIKLVVGKLKLARQRAAGRPETRAGCGGVGREVEDKRTALDRRIARGIELMRAPFGGGDTFPKVQYGAKKSQNYINNGDANYNMNSQQSSLDFANEAELSFKGNLGVEEDKPACKRYFGKAAKNKI